MKKKTKILIIIISVIIGISLLLITSFYVLKHIGYKQFHADDTNIEAAQVAVDDEKTIYYNDKKFILNEDIVNVVFIGIDKDNIYEDLGVGNNGQADTIFVAAFDTKNKKSTIIPISRETMVDVNVYTKDGNYAGVEYEQLCLAYAYGNTPKSCSENVMRSVRRILYNINVSSYVTVDLEGIGSFTNLIGGLNVTALDNISLPSGYVNKGQSVNLKGKDAVRYIQHRSEAIDGNQLRMERQKQFLSVLATTAGNEVMRDFTKLSSYYSTLTPYFYSNISLSQITYLASECLTVNFGDFIEYKNISGELTQGEWAQFTPDKDALLDIVVQTFYIEAK